MNVLSWSVDMNDHLARLLPDEPFPAYAFVPGLFPHPTSDPKGHSYGKEPIVPAKIEPDRWRECRPYLYGIDLFNAGYFWESYVAWESLWLACGRKGTVADFLKGLIHLAAAGVKARERRVDGVKSHGRRAAELFHSLEPQEKIMGFRIGELIGLADEIHDEGWPGKQPMLMPNLDDD